MSAASGPTPHEWDSSTSSDNGAVLSRVKSWFDPRELHDVGERPDYRFSLANERTFLAWLRTGLALVAGGLAIAQFFPQLAIPHLKPVLSLTLIIGGAVVAVRAVDHWIRCEIAMRLDQPLPPSRFPALLALLVTVGALLLAADVVIDAIR